MTYTEAKNILDSKRGDKNRKKIGNNTYLIRYSDYIAIVLHYTEVLRFYPDNQIVLDSGGWQTYTTKNRINTYLPSPYYLLQKKSKWFIDDGKEGLLPFKDNMSLYL